jgi:hypothetical protein
MKLSATIFAAAVLAIGTLAHSQSASSTLSVNIPFAFTAQSARLPAGRYLVWYDEDYRAWKLQTYGHVDVELKPVRQKHSSMGQRNTLSFERVNDNYTLTEIQKAGMPVARIAPKTATQNEVASASSLQLAGSR